MTAGPDTARHIAAALDALRGRPPTIDYVLLLVTPFAAAAGGYMIAVAVDTAVERRRAHRRLHRHHSDQP